MPQNAEDSKIKNDPILVVSRTFALDRYLTRIRTLDEVVKMFLDILYVDGTKLERMEKRDMEIRHLFSEGITKTEIARRYSISARRVGQILYEIES